MFELNHVAALPKLNSDNVCRHTQVNLTKLDETSGFPPQETNVVMLLQQVCLVEEEGKCAGGSGGVGVVVVGNHAEGKSSLG